MATLHGLGTTVLEMSETNCGGKERLPPKLNISRHIITLRNVNTSLGLAGSQYGLSLMSLTVKN